MTDLDPRVKPGDDERKKSPGMTKEKRARG